MTLTFLHVFYIKTVKRPTRITSSISTMIDRVLANYPESVTQGRVEDIGLSDHQLIYYTRKITKITRGAHKQIKFIQAL